MKFNSLIVEISSQIKVTIRDRTSALSIPKDKYLYIFRAGANSKNVSVNSLVYSYTSIFLLKFLIHQRVLVLFISQFMIIQCIINYERFIFSMSCERQKESMYSGKINLDSMNVYIWIIVH